MKKIVAIVLVLILCLSLLACNMPPDTTEPSGTGEVGNTGTTDGAQTTPPPVTTVPIGFTEVPKPDNLPVSDWTAYSIANIDIYAFMDSGCYYLFNQCLYYLDTATGHSVGLCSKPGCLHGESTSSKDLRSCDAYIPGFVSMMFFYDGVLYYVISGPSGYELYARSHDGLNLRKVGELCSQYISKNTSAQIQAWAISYGKLYYSLSIDEFIIGEDGSSTQASIAFALAMFDLSTGKEKVLVHSEDDIISLLGANKDMALIWMSHQVTMEETLRPDYIEYMKQFPSYLRLWHKDSGGVSTLCEMERLATDKVLGFANGKMHLSGSEGTKIYAYDFASMTFTDSDLPPDVNRIWSEKYGGVKWEGYYDLESGTYYTNEYATMELPNGIERFGASPCAFGRQGFVVKEFYSTDGIVVFSDFVYFPFEKMNDGMQLSDRILFMRREDGKGYTLIQPEG